MSIKTRVLLVVNPISGGRDKDPIVEQLTKKISEKEFQQKIYKTSGKSDKEKLTEIVEEFRPDRIIIVGGDGTLKLLAEILKDDSVALGLIPAGSANGLAENLELPSETPAQVDVALGNNFIYLDTIQINHELCLHISDVGLNAALIRNYEEGNVRGKLGYLIQSIPTLVKSNFPFQFTIEKEGKRINRKAVLLGIANARRYGTGSTINPQGKYDDGKFEILVFKEFNIPEILKTFREEVNPDKDFLEIFSASEAKITCEKNVPFQIDGEYRGEVREVHARISESKVKIAVPLKKSSSKA